MVDTNFDFYKRVTDDREFSRFFLDWLFERFAGAAGRGGDDSGGGAGRE